MYTSLRPHPKITVTATVNAGYLKGCTDMNASTIINIIVIEDATEMGHLE